MSSKEFNLLVSLLIEMLKDGKTDKAIELLEEAKGKEDNKNNSSDK